MVRTLLGQLIYASRSSTSRRAAILTIRSKLVRSSNVFQPYNDTFFDRYPDIFSALSTDDYLEILSFGCSTGEELFSLRKYFRGAHITGLDASGANVTDSRKKIAQAADSGMQVRQADSAKDEVSGHYDLIFAMAVFRHGALSHTNAKSCADFIRFDSFETSIVDLVRCLKVGGRLAVENSNFRVADTVTSADLRCVLSLPRTSHNPQAPIYGRDNQLLEVASYPEVVFEKVDAAGWSEDHPMKGMPS